MSIAEASSKSRYRSLERLASGGMGEVELAVRTEGQFRRLFAVKRLLSTMRDDENARTMFLDEARLAGLVRHPNVVSVLDVGEDERGPYLAMDFVEGISAGTLLSWCAKHGVTLPVQLCVRVVREIALGLHAAHELIGDDGESIGLVHRDVSPQNILIGFDGIARIADFGIAKAVGRTTRTTAGLLKGKAGYMSPEQLRFEEPDRRSDIFSLAVVLYELLAGARLYKSENDIATARRILNEPPPDIDDVREDVPPEIVELLFASLAKDPAARPETAQVIAQRLESALASLATEEGPLDVGEYIREHFAERRAKLLARLAELRTRASEAPVIEVAPSTVTIPGPRRYVLAASLVLALCASIGVVWAFSMGGDTTTEIATPTAPPIVARPIEASAAEPAPIEAPPTEPVVTAPGDSSAAMREEPARAPRARARRTRRSAPEPERDELFHWQ